jgi:predicted lipoprotein
VKRSARRTFLLGLGALGATVAGGGGASCRRPDPRARALAATVKRVLLPDARVIVEASRGLVAAFARLAATPGDQALVDARAAWQQALLCWQRTFATQLGPFVTTGALLRASFWPVRRAALAHIVNGSQAIDAKLIEALGADAKGLFAIEHLLFEGDPDAPPARWLNGARRERAGVLCLALARYVESYASRAAAALGSGDEFTAEFVRGGQLSLSRLVSQMLFTVENAAIRMDRAMLGLRADQRLRRSATQGEPSGLSAELLRTWLATTRRVYAHGEDDGVAALARTAAPAAADSVQAAFSAASRALAAIRQPLETAAHSDPALLSAAIRDLKMLEVTIRSELGSALGVTITFSSADGD